ncbi:Deoxynucleoside kinase [Carpediemonas membranifera]|uniref:Deoxynucleoside kinase n=1 Tax=Carpediemonas membranifera TaxID=201153 RepID=A0A8J6BA72_9EUKA|nr:Deoxynucleoside kinase [Carpediemonas membranifera]|eukprot:KAG9395957.1 Deoxynucleoside kinase [Carpediemonas membranifera]
MSKTMQSKLIVVEGNIGAGKSSLCTSLSNTLGYTIYEEPVKSNPYLEDFYKDPHRIAPIMQRWLFEQRLATYKDAVLHIEETGQGVILDRSVFSDWAFAYQSLVDGFFTEQQYEEYQTMREVALRGLPLPTMCIYLDVSPEQCLYRITQLRKRECEAGMPIEYLRGLDAAHAMLLDDLEKVGIEVLRVDWESFGDIEPIEKSVQRTPLNTRLWGVSRDQMPRATLFV